MKQTRFIPFEDCGLQIREPQEGQTESRTIEGTPIVFGVRSVNLTPWSDTREVYEVLEPGCITQELISRSDVILNLNHSNMVPDVLGRCRNGKGTLELELRENKIGCRCDLPRTNNANDALELMKRGDITGMSFAFEDDYQDSENGVSYERTAETHDGKEVWLRHVKRITGLYDVAIVTHPAYEQTSVGVRELGDVIDKAIDLQIEIEKREAEEEQKRACGGGKDDKREDDPEDVKDNDPKEDPDDMHDEDEERERMIAMQHRRSMRRHLVERMIDSL
jgi:HK97 family phage prohead protease